MVLSRRHVLSGVLATPSVIATWHSRPALAAQTLKISHQFPGGTITEGDFRDRLCRMFAAEVERRRSMGHSPRRDANPALYLDIVL